MRSRHPELYAAESELVPSLSKDELEYRLETMGNRQEEQLFEQLARALMQLEVCPNIKPMTGPTGGGDGKRDAETYPVDEALGLSAYWGSATSRATQEDWAFAFSTQEDWRQKARSDCKSIATLPKVFDKVFVVTSRFAPSKKRSELEAALAQEHGFRVEILDRTWITSKVFANGRQRQVSEILGLDVKESQDRSDPAMAERQHELNDLLAQLSAPMDNYGGNPYALALDYTRAARLSRTLGKPHPEVDGLLLKAKEISDRSADIGLKIRIAYDRAWTAVYWYDDFRTLLSAYLELEQNLEHTGDPYHFEQAHNLYLTL